MILLNGIWSEPQHNLFVLVFVDDEPAQRGSVGLGDLSKPTHARTLACMHKLGARTNREGGRWRKRSLRVWVSTGYD